MKDLPYNLELEQWLLWAIIIDNWILDNIVCNESDFYNVKHKVIFRIFKALKKADIVIDVLMIKDFIDKKKLEEETWWIIYILELIEKCSSSTFFESYDKTIKEYSNRRNIILKWRKFEQIGYEEDLDSIYKEIWELNNLTIKKWKSCWINEITDRFFEFIESCKKRWWLGIKWPYPLLDKYIWWVIPWKVYTIVAYSNVWKSNFAYSYVVDMLKKWKKVLFFSLEVQVDMLFNQLLKAYYNIWQKEILADNFYFEMESFKNLFIYDSVYKLEEMKWICKTEKPDIIFIDYIQNIEVKWMTEYEQMTRVAIEIQRLAIETWITIFSISQANNDSRFKDSDKIQPKWSWAIFASSDIILALSREWEMLNLNIIKNKFWMNNKSFLINPDFSKCRFDITEEKQPEKNYVNEFNL